MTPAEFEFKYVIAVGVFTAKTGEPPLWLHLNTKLRRKLLANGTLQRDEGGYIKYHNLIVTSNEDFKGNFALGLHTNDSLMRF